MGNGFSGVKSQVTPLEEFYAVVLRAKPYFSADNLIRLTGTKIIDAIFNVCETVERVKILPGIDKASKINLKCFSLELL